MPAGMVIVGAGECGSRAALALRDNGYDGPVTLIGAEDHLPYERPPLSKAVLCDAPPTIIADEAKLAGASIDRILASVTAIDRDRHEVVLGDRRLGYDKLLVATGARPRRLE